MSGHKYKFRHKRNLWRLYIRSPASSDQPDKILYRSSEPILKSELPEELNGIVPGVVFPTGVDRRDDLGKPNRFDIYYGMADNSIGVVQLDIPDELPGKYVLLQKRTTKAC